MQAGLHNSGLEAALDIGLAGLVLVVSARGDRAGGGPQGCLPAPGEPPAPSTRAAVWSAITVFVVLTHLTESFVSWFSYMWVLLVVVAWGRPGATNR
ncbi:MAG: hypothetical protein R2716_12755 [Microthrixaceae bacterium]